MSPHSAQGSPWPLQTPPPLDPPPPPRPKRKRQQSMQDHSQPVAGTSKSIIPRQIADSDRVALAKTECMWRVGNDVISCYPTSSTVIYQREYATFVWNSRRPELTQTNRVNIYLFGGETLEQILFMPNVINPGAEAGMVTARVNDSWWGDRGMEWSNRNITYTFYWLITRSDAGLDGSQLPQATFTAIQTTYADAVASSMSSSASSASAAAASSSALNQRPSATGLQAGASQSSFPHWAIAVIAILAFLAISAFCMLLFVLMRRVSGRDRPSSRNSVGSASPMMGNVGTSAVAAPVDTSLLAKKASSSAGHHVPSVGSPGDGASMASRSGSGGDTGPFSGADAAIMADAFRKALRKPDFAGQPAVEEGDSSDKDGALISKELAEEGRDIRSVGSSRGVKVEETMSSSGETATDHGV